jgi:hypothetical protein
MTEPNEEPGEASPSRQSGSLPEPPGSLLEPPGSFPDECGLLAETGRRLRIWTAKTSWTRN